MSIYLHGIGHYHPENEITNHFLSELDIGTTNEWIMQRLGIRSRRTVLPLEYIRQTQNKDPRAALEAADINNAGAAAHAALMALERSGISKDDIGMVIAGCSAPDTLSPAEACNIAKELEIEVPSFDINSACTSLFGTLYVLSLMQPDKLPPFILLATPERLTCTVDYTDRSSAVIWGDAATAMVVSFTEPARARIFGNRLESSPARNDKVVVPRVGFFNQDGRIVQTIAIRKTTQTLRSLQGEFQDPQRTMNFIGHQANVRMLEAVCQQVDILPENHYSNAEFYGNTAAAGAPSVISMNWDKWTGKDDIAVVGVGSGMSWGGFWLQFMDSQ